MAAAIAFFALAAVPGVYTRWSSRTLLRSLEDPLLPDRILAHSHRVGVAVGLSLVPVVAFVPAALPPFLLFAWIAVLAGGFRARKVVFTESWSFLRYLDHTLRFWFGFGGSLFLIASLPSIIAFAGERALSAGALAGALACLWIFGAPRVFRFLVRGRTLEGESAALLGPLFTPLLRNAKCPSPELYRAGVEGGSWVNGFALPAIRRPGVLFTDGLLKALTLEETAAIFAHELAHLEHHTPRKILRGRSLAVLLIALTVFLWAGPFSDRLRDYVWIWPLLCLFAIRFRAGHNQAHEADSDRRAIELGADPEALVSALEKLHALLRVSRRWDAAYERLSTHPSLARRIRRIRIAAGKGEIAVAPEPNEAIFHAADESGRAVRFDASCVHWLRGLPEEGDLLARSQERRTYRYRDLVELRLDGRGENRILVQKDHEGGTMRMAVVPGDVLSIEAILDRVDSLFREPTPVERGPTGRPASLAALLVGLVIALPSIAWTVVALAVVALARPSEASLLALGAASLGTALFRALALDPWWKPLALAVAGITALPFAIVWKRRKIPRTPLDERLAILVPLALVLLATVSAGAIYFSALPAMQLHLWARDTSTVFAGLIAVAAVLARMKESQARAGAVLALAAATGQLALGSSSFRERFGNDLFAELGPPLPVKELSLTPLRELTVPGAVSELVLSPAGTRVAVSTAFSDEAAYRGDPEFLLERDAGDLRSLTALDLAYLDEEMVLILAKSRATAGLELSAASADGSSSLFHELPLLAGATLDVDGGGKWQVRGTDWESGAHVVLRGTLGPEPPLEMHFSETDLPSTLVSVNRDGFALLQRYEYPDAFPYFALLGRASSWVSAFELRGKNGEEVSLGRSALQAHCFSTPPGAPRFFCSSNDRGRTAFFSIDALSGSVLSLGHISGFAYGEEVVSGSLLPLVPWGQPATIVDLEREIALRPTGAELREAIFTIRGDVLAAARTEDGGDETRVSLYTVGR